MDIANMPSLEDLVEMLFDGAQCLLKDLPKLNQILSSHTES